MFILDLNAARPVESFSTKCPTCKEMTHHIYTKIEPLSDEPADPMEMLKLIKRLTLCTKCGTLRLIN